MPNPANIDLKQLRFFVAVVDAGSISKASKLLHIAQPALSKRIASLEYDLSAELIHRGHTGVQVTDQGMMLYRAAQRVLRDMESVVEQVHAGENSPVGPVRVGCLHSLTTLVSAPLTIRAIETLPSVRLSVVAGQSIDLYRALIDGALDVALFVWDDEARNIDSDLKIEEEIFIASAPKMQGLPKRDCFDPKDLSEVPFIFPTAKTFASGPHIVDHFRRLGIELKIVAEVDGDAIRQLVAGGHGATVLPWSHLQSEVADGRIALRSLAGAPMTRILTLATASERPRSLATRAVTRLMAELIKTQIDSGDWRHARET